MPIVKEKALLANMKEISLKKKLRNKTLKTWSAVNYSKGGIELKYMYIYIYIHIYLYVAIH